MTAFGALEEYITNHVLFISFNAAFLGRSSLFSFVSWLALYKKNHIHTPDWHTEVFHNMALILRRYSNRKLELFKLFFFVPVVYNPLFFLLRENRISKEYFEEKKKAFYFSPSNWKISKNTIFFISMTRIRF